MAMRRVINRRSQGAMRKFKYPSITTWPASVPVMVELCPAATKATPNKIEAHSVPANGARNLYESWISETSYIPALKKVEAAKINIAEFTKKAALSAMAESMRLYLMADQIPFSLVLNLRVCTSD